MQPTRWRFTGRCPAGGDTINRRSEMKVLIVEDSAVMQQRLRDMVEAIPNGEVVGVTGHAGMGIVLLKSEKPDAIIIDLALNGGSGMTVLGHIIQHRLPVRTIIFSNHTDPVTKSVCLEKGADYYLDKAYDFAKLSGILAALI